jgi:uncharacterized protein (TIGR02145 family)
MKKIPFGVMLIAILVFTLMQISCKKGDPSAKPTLTTLTVSEISVTTAKSGGKITDDGGSEVISKGIVWSTTSAPTIENFDGITMEGSVGVYFESDLTNLTPSTTYYVRAYATNSAGTGYGAQQTFATQAPPAITPKVTTSSVTGITQTTATCGGNVTLQGTSAVNARGVCWSTSPSPTIASSTTNDGTGTGLFTSNITGLNPSTTYYVRAYATNSVGTAYGNEESFSTLVVVNPCAGVTAPAGYGIVESSGKCWLDRDLGAKQVATSSTDTNAYGHLYQWGRIADGHQIITSITTTALSSSNTPGHGDFIIAPTAPRDWRSPQNDNLWQGANGENNPCPTGFRVPTEAEWDAERLSWSSNDYLGAFASPLKLPVAGYRYYSSGSHDNVGLQGSYWSSTVAATATKSLHFASGVAPWHTSSRAYGFAVRCLKD